MSRSPGAPIMDGTARDASLLVVHAFTMAPPPVRPLGAPFRIASVTWFTRLNHRATREEIQKVIPESVGIVFVMDLSLRQVVTKEDDMIDNKATTARRRNHRLATGAVGLLLAGGIAGGALAAASATATSPSATSAGSGAAGGGGSNARSGPASGGASGTVGSLSTSSFTMSTSAGQKVTVDEASSTTYQKQASSTSASAITKGESVLVLGTTSGTTITATQVIAQPTGGGSAASSAAGVIPFQRGAPTTSKQVGQIPANYSQGSGTIVSGTTAYKATEAALAAYPGASSTVL